MPLNSLRVRPTTYTVAVYVLAVVLLFEVVMVISVFWLRSMVVPVNFQVPKAFPAVATKPVPFIPPILPPDVPNLAVSGKRTLLSLPSANDKQTQMGNFLDQARDLRRQNDLKGAVNVLVQAEDLDPRNPDALQGLAEVYYLLNDPVRSKIYWQRLVDLGPAVGRAYSLARDHVLLLNSTPNADALQAPSVLGRDVYVDSVEKTPVDTQGGAPVFRLRVVLMRRDPTDPTFDQQKLQPYVIFYQNTGDPASTPGPDALKADLRPHRGGFEDILLFKDKRLKEALTVEYTLPVPGTPGPDGKPMGEYYGYVIGIYYDKTLQDVRSEPADLITRLPLPDGIE
jgi:hypothetical protein